MAYPRTPVEERFRQKFIVCKRTGCWLWTDAPDRYGYGRLQMPDPPYSVKAHRLSYILHIGPVADDLLVCHTCDRPICVNPDHLFVGTNVDNMKDMVSKGRSITMINPQKGERNGRAKLSEADVLDIRSRKGIKVADLCKEFGVAKTAIERVIMGVSWKHLLG